MPGSSNGPAIRHGCRPFRLRFQHVELAPQRSQSRRCQERLNARACRQFQALARQCRAVRSRAGRYPLRLRGHKSDPSRARHRRRRRCRHCAVLRPRCALRGWTYPRTPGRKSQQRVRVAHRRRRAQYRGKERQWELLRSPLWSFRPCA